jgi:rhodanese-related sulfurtransferase
MVREVDIKALAAAAADGATVIDVREPEEYRSGHVPKARLVPLAQLAQRASELPRHEPIYLVCAGGSRSKAAAEYLAAAGFDAVSVAGGTEAWKQAGLPLVYGTREAVA